MRAQLRVARLDTPARGSAAARRGAARRRGRSGARSAWCSRSRATTSTCAIGSRRGRGSGPRRAARRDSAAAVGEMRCARVTSTASASASRGTASRWPRASAQIVDDEVTALPAAAPRKCSGARARSKQSSISSGRCSARSPRPRCGATMPANRPELAAQLAGPSTSARRAELSRRRSAVCCSASANVARGRRFPDFHGAPRTRRVPSDALLVLRADGPLAAASAQRGGASGGRARVSPRSLERYVDVVSARAAHAAAFDGIRSTAATSMVSRALRHSNRASSRQDRTLDLHRQQRARVVLTQMAQKSRGRVRGPNASQRAKPARAKRSTISDNRDAPGTRFVQ